MPWEVGVLLKDVPFAIDAKGEEKFCWQWELVLKRSYGVVINDKGGYCWLICQWFQWCMVIDANCWVLGVPCGALLAPQQLPFIVCKMKGFPIRILYKVWFYFYIISYCDFMVWFPFQRWFIFFLSIPWPYFLEFW